MPPIKPDPFSEFLSSPELKTALQTLRAQLEAETLQRAKTLSAIQVHEILLQAEKRLEANPTLARLLGPQGSPLALIQRMGAIEIRSTTKAEEAAFHSPGKLFQLQSGDYIYIFDGHAGWAIGLRQGTSQSVTLSPAYTAN